MQNNIIEKLFGSFSELEQAINQAKSTLAEKDAIPEEIMERLDSYDGILVKQRRLAHELCEHIAKEDWEEVNRCVGLINGLSSMIRDDARAILSSLAINTDRAEGSDVNFC